MGGSHFGMPRISRWTCCIVLGLFLFGLFALSSPVQAETSTLIHPLVFPDGALYVFNPGPGQTSVTYTFYHEGTKAAEVAAHTLLEKRTERIELSEVTGLTAGTPYSLVISSGIAVESTVYTNRTPENGDGLGGYRGVAPYEGAVFGPFFYDPVNGIVSSVTLFNSGSDAIDVTVTFTNADGTPAGGGPATLPGLSSTGITSLNIVALDPGFTGTVQVTAAPSTFAGVLADSRANQFSLQGAIYDSNHTVPSSENYNAYFPRLLRVVTEGYVTRSSELVVFNPGNTDVNASIYLFDSDLLIDSDVLPVAAKGMILVDLQGFPLLQDGSAYSALVSSVEPLYLSERTLLDKEPYLPVAGYGGSSQDQLFLTGLRRETGLGTTLSVQNASATDQAIQVNFYDLSGVSRYQYNDSVPANDAVRLDLEHLPGLGGAFEGSAVIDGLSGSVAAWVDRAPVPTALFLPAIDRNTCVSGLISPHAITDDYFSWQTNMVQIHADDAWKQCNMGNSDMVVAVIDTGVDLNHPDLEGRLLPGYDFANGDTSAQDYNGHGTHVAGIVAAGMNGEGVVGVAPNVKVLPVQVLTAEGYGITSWIVNGIYWAADRAQVINLSLGSRYDDPNVRNAINYAVQKGRLVIAAAGNCGNGYYGQNGCDYMNQPLYPAAYSNVLAVAAVDDYDARATFSNVGSYIDVAAPGVYILSSYYYYGSSYEMISGTSQASPHVAGLAALVWSKYPSYTAAQVRSVIESSVEDLGSNGWDSSFGWGRIDAAAALGVSGSLSVPDAPLEEQSVEPDPREDRQAEILEGFVLVKFKPEVSDAGLQKAMSAFPQMRLESTLPALGVQRFQVPAGEEWKLIDLLRARADVEYAGPEYIYYAQ